MSSDQIIYLNVGGKLFQTIDKTLEKSKYFLHLLNNPDEIIYDDDNNIFIDHDPKNFELILNFLRSREIYFDKRNEEIFDDFNYFGIDMRRNRLNESKLIKIDRMFNTSTKIRTLDIYDSINFYVDVNDCLYNIVAKPNSTNKFDQLNNSFDDDTGLFEINNNHSEYNYEYSMIRDRLMKIYTELEIFKSYSHILTNVNCNIIVRNLNKNKFYFIYPVNNDNIDNNINVDEFNNFTNKDGSIIEFDYYVLDKYNSLLIYHKDGKISCHAYNIENRLFECKGYLFLNNDKLEFHQDYLDHETYHFEAIHLSYDNLFLTVKNVVYYFIYNNKNNKFFINNAMGTKFIKNHLTAINNFAFLGDFIQSDNLIITNKNIYYIDTINDCTLKLIRYIHNLNVNDVDYIVRHHNKHHPQLTLIYIVYMKGGNIIKISKTKKSEFYVEFE